MAKSFEQLHLERAHKDSLERVRKAGFKEESKRIRWAYESKIEGCGGKRSTKKSGVKCLTPKGKSGPCIVTKYDNAGNVVDKSIVFVKE